MAKTYTIRVSRFTLYLKQWGCVRLSNKDNRFLFSSNPINMKVKMQSGVHARGFFLTYWNRQLKDPTQVCGIFSEPGELLLRRATMYTRAVFYGCVVLVLAGQSSWLVIVSQETKRCQVYIPGTLQKCVVKDIAESNNGQCNCSTHSLKEQRVVIHF